MHCGASVSESYHIFIGSMVVTYILHVCIVHMHNRIFIQIYASAVWVECLALSLSVSLIFPAFALLFLLHVGFSLSESCFHVCSSLAVIFVLGCNGFRALLEVFRICMFKTTIKS